MAGEENLRPFGTLTKEEQRKIASMGGKASGEARARRKTFRELFEAALSIKNEDGLTEQEKIVLRAIEVAKSTGNYKDIEATIGEKPLDKLNIGNEDGDSVTTINLNFADRSKRSNYKDKDPLIVDGGALKEDKEQ